MGICWVEMLKKQIESHFGGFGIVANWNGNLKSINYASYGNTWKVIGSKCKKNDIIDIKNLLKESQLL